MSRLADSAEPEEHSYNYDLIVIGGGSGGLACSKEAMKVSTKPLKVAVLDFVRPSPKGTKWGLGGTCVNVGCIPKKLMHTAAIMGEHANHDAPHYGWKTDKSVTHDWTKLVGAVQDHIGSLNWGYRVALRDKNVEYRNEYAKFIDPHTVEVKNKAGKVSQITARRFVIAIGGRPTPLDIPGGEHAITSDDIFAQQEPPGKTLVIGGSYVALECAGFLAGLGFEVSLMVRSIFLRGFDQSMAEEIGRFMEAHSKIKMLRPTVPTKIEKQENGKLKVFFKNMTSGEESSDIFDTVLSAVGRKPETHLIDLDKAGVKIDPTTGKIPVVNEQTNVPHIYAIGDIIKGGLELTPVAIKAGRFLSRRLYANESIYMDYSNVATTVFTPVEYGCIGLAEEDAEQKFGKNNIEVYHLYFKPLEWTISEREDNICYCKLITNKLDKDRVVGLHYLGPNAGEVTQGYAVAIKMGATYYDFERTIGIHPTTSEEFTTLNITKSSGENAKSRGC